MGALLAQAQVVIRRERTVKQIIPSNEIAFHPLSFQDEAGRLFRWRGALYRGISAQSAPFITAFLQGDAGQKLVADGLLIDTKMTPFAMDGFELVLGHRLLPLVSYPFEWCTAMFKAAVLTIINLAITLSRHDLMLKDAHPWNVLFDGCRPVWIDLTSITPANGSREWPAEGEFFDNCVHPLILMSQGREKLTKLLIAEYEALQPTDLEMLGVSRSLSIDVTTALLSRLPEQKRKALRKTLRPLRSLFLKKTESSAPIPLLQRLEQIRAEVANIAVPFWEPRPSHHSFEPDSKWNAKQLSMHRILTEKKPRTVLDIASGSGWFSELAAQFSENVAAFDTDPEAVSRLFASARAQNLPILPLVMDFTRPTPARGIASHSHVAATERFQCEVVLMLGFLHELVFRYRRLGMDEICDGLAQFSKRWAVVEFIPGDDPEVGPLWSPWFAGYTLDNFKVALSRHFSKIEVWPSHPDPRVLLLCER
jgi:SAM-dependent methyltransferase